MNQILADSSSSEFKVSNADLLGSIARLADQPNQQNRDEFIQRLLGATLLVPLALEIPPTEPGETVICTDADPLSNLKNGFPVACMLCDDESLVFPAFTDREALSRFADDRTICLVVQTLDLFRYFLRYSADSFAVNPMSEESVQISREEVEKIVGENSVKMRLRF